MLDKQKLRECFEVICEIQDEFGYRSVKVADGTIIPIVIRLDAHWFVNPENWLVLSDTAFDIGIDAKKSDDFTRKIWPGGVRRKEGFTLIQLGDIDSPPFLDRSMYVLDNDKECQNPIVTRHYQAHWEQPKCS